MVRPPARSPRRPASTTSRSRIGTRSYADPATRYVAHCYEAVHDGPVTPQADEVAWMNWMSLDDLLALLDDPGAGVVPDSTALLRDRLEAGLR